MTTVVSLCPFGCGQTISVLLLQPASCQLTVAIGDTELSVETEINCTMASCHRCCCYPATASISRSV